MAYSEKVIEHYENPHNVGTLDKDDPSVGTGLVGAPACGDVMRLQIRVSESGVIVVSRISSEIRPIDTRVCCQESKTCDSCWMGEKNIVR